ncbi:Ig-like domain-containing protein [Myxococcus landrumensis]|uniref:Ig-like domain-containing protein n=1 Tax=Myxococcus landrumensis TaxID=2813577 RepID=A0ABX7NAQ4_9BACT|nr:Ig-like domain-containing protein [Myxococcus landrumus]QSQ14506.1 Ig-like domain-containing protein [Myxococcus landrumus]
MTNRLRLLTPLFSFFLLFGCINVPEVVDPPDGGENPAQDFELGVTPLEETVAQGGVKTLQVTVVRKNGFQGSVDVALEKPPAGVSAPSVTIPESGTTATLRVSVAANLPPRRLSLTVRGSSGTIQQDRSVALNVVSQGNLTVSWVSPSESRSAVNGPVSLEVSVEGAQAEQVELMKGATVLHTWTAAPYVYQWSTAEEAEGEFALKARATRGGTTYFSDARTIAVDRSAPQVESRMPTAGATQVSVAAEIRVRFSEAVRGASVTPSNVTLSGSGGSSIPATVEVSSDGRTVTVAPVNRLPTSTTVTVNLGTSTQPVVDLAGNAFAGPREFSFATEGPATDTTPPTILSTTPGNAAIGIARNTLIEIVFSEPMNKASVEGAFVILAPAGLNTGTLRWNTSSTVMTYSFPTELSYGTELRWQISTNARDTEGNALAETAAQTFRTIRQGIATFAFDSETSGSVDSPGFFRQTSFYNVAMVGDSAGNFIDRLFLGFQMSTLPEELTVIRQARLKWWTGRQIGDPFGKLGKLILEPVNIGDVLPIKFDTNPELEKAYYSHPLASGINIPPSSIGRPGITDVTPMVIADWANRASRNKRTQYRLRFEIGTAGDGTLHRLYSDSESDPKLAELEISYEYP